MGRYRIEAVGDMFKRLLVQLCIAAATLAIAPAAFAAGGNYVFAGGSPAEQAQVTAALDASSFPWGVVPGPVVVNIQRGVSSSAAPGQIWLDADLLDAGRFSWGVVQHEYAHQVDFALLDTASRAQLHALLGGTAWSGPEGHSSLDCERFADLVSWSYWGSADNVMKPLSTTDEGGEVSPAVFRAALAAILPGLPATPLVQVAAVKAAPIRATASVKVAPAKHRRA
jgi:hypothetical protein